MDIGPPERPEDDIAAYLRNNRNKQKASRRANPKQSADRNQAVTLAHQDAQRARKQQEERARLQELARQKLAGTDHNLPASAPAPAPFGSTTAFGSASATISVNNKTEHKATAAFDMHNPPRSDGTSSSTKVEDLSEEAAIASAMEMESPETDGSLFVPMAESTQLHDQPDQPFHSDQSIHTAQPARLVQSNRSLQPNQNISIAPMMPTRPSSRRSIGPVQTPRQRDDDGRQFEIRHDDDAQNSALMRGNTSHTHSPKLPNNLSVQTFQVNEANQSNHPSHASSPTPLPPTFELTAFESRKRKRETLSTHQSMAEILRSLERLDQQQDLDIASRDSEIMRLKLQLSDMRSLTLSAENKEDRQGRKGETITQVMASLREEIAGLKKGKVENEYRIRDLEESILEKDAEILAAEDWHSDKETLEEKLRTMETQLSTSQFQLSRLLEAFARETTLRTTLHKNLESQERFNVKLSKDLKKKSEDVKMMGEEREKYVQLSGAVRGLFGHVQMETMSSESFGDCGRALKRVRDLVVDEQGKGNEGGSRK
ncbi:hypothetical protein FKW77_004979 [Venturia effusa]|uniref:Uncharacterized protein n=1 Tax=Venturia effusa TaxID=50376 RepID=A0A517L7B2_9PEZI|nr:hypothetical protein FKW77_004979 [Venturia effusa]